MSIFDKLKKEKNEEGASKTEVAPVNVADVKKTESKKEVKTKDKKVAKTPKKEDSQSNQVYGILVRPLITEKASNLASLNQYAFEVGLKANKIQITAAIEKRYGVKPISVNVINNRSRKVRFGRTSGSQKAWRKAIVTLPKGKTIQIHEGS
jgi:large subunit ribosomal protein L23